MKHTFIRVPSLATTALLASTLVLADMHLCSTACAQNSKPATAPAQPQAAPPAQPPAQGGQDGQQDGQRGNRRMNMFGGGRGGMGMGRMGGPGMQNQMRAAFEADFTRRDVPLFKDQLTLDEAQMNVLETLMRDYEDAFNPAREEMQKEMQDLGRQMMAPMMNGDMQQKMGEAMQKAREQMEQLANEKGTELTQEERQRFFRDSMEKMGEEMRKELKSNGTFDQLRAGLKPIVTDFTKWRETKARLRKSFEDSLQASLNDAQKKKWPAFERFLAREKTLPWGSISGEQVNLFLVLDESGLSKETFQKLQTIMDDYELQLDQALKTRNDFMASNESKFLEAVAAGDTDGAKRFATRMMELRQQVRDVNDRYREAIVAELSPEDGARVKQAALAASYERVYRPSRVQRAFEGALKLEGLDPSVIESIKALQTQYFGEVTPLNDRMVAAIRKTEPAQQTDEVVRVVGMLNGDVSFTSMFRPQRDEGEVGELMEKRSDLNETYMERLANLLTDEQFDQIPLGPENRGGPGGGQGGGRGMFGGSGPIQLADVPEGMRDRIKQFDANNDGTIDDTERQKMMEDFRSRGGFGGGPGGPPADGAGNNDQGGQRQRRNRGGQGGGGQGGGGQNGTTPN